MCLVRLVRLVGWMDLGGWCDGNVCCRVVGCNCSILPDRSKFCIVGGLRLSCGGFWLGRRIN